MSFYTRLMRQPSALVLMRQQVRALYTLKGDELHLIADTDPQGRTPAPRFFLGRTAEGNVWHVRHDLPASLKAELTALGRSEPHLSRAEPQIAAAVRHWLGTGTEWRGPAYWLPASAASEQATEITAENVALLDAHFPNTAGRARAGASGPVAAVIRGKQAVAVCSCVRLSDQAAEAGVHTLAAFRGQGYALAAVALWADLVRAQGLLPLYSTSWENLASQAVARKLGAVMYGEDWSVE